VEGSRNLTNIVASLPRSTYAFASLYRYERFHERFWLRSAFREDRCSPALLSLFDWPDYVASREPDFRVVENYIPE